MVTFNETADPHRQFRSKVLEAISRKSSVDLTGVNDVTFTCQMIEDALKASKLNYRIRTENRSALPATAAGSGAALIGVSAAIEAAAISAPTIVAGAAIAGTALTGVGAIVLAGYGLHRLFTASPDYEVVLNRTDKTVKLIYKK